MKIPKYIQDILNRSRFAVGEGDPGYSIRILKGSPYTKVETFRTEIERLMHWVEKQMPTDEYSIPTMVVNDIPAKTHYVNQSALVTIYDPVMKKIEQYIGR